MVSGTESKAGDQLLGRYELHSRIASGGMGTVFEATDGRLGRRVAVKILRTELAADPKFVERFRREARAVAALAHPNIATVFDYGESDGRHFIVMELAGGRDLERVIADDGPLDPSRAVRIAEQICDALGHAHAAGVVHRDVKPANVIVADHDLVKVTDLGIARAVGDSTLTATGNVLGSAHYLSPEQAEGNPATASSDLYALGIVIFEMLTGAVPFTGSSPVGVAMRHLTDRVPPPSSVNPGLPPRLDEVVATATARAPSDRYPTAAAMALALQDAIEAAPATTAEMTPRAAPPTTEQTVWPIPGTRWDPNRIGRVVAVVFGLLAATAAALLIARIGSNDTPARQRSKAGAAATPANPAAAAPASVPPSATTVPDVAGDKFKNAEKSLRELGFEVERNDVSAEGVERDVVIATDPAVGSAVEPGQAITLIVSAGPQDEEHGEGHDNPGHGGEPPGQDKKDKEHGD